MQSKLYSIYLVQTLTTLRMHLSFIASEPVNSLMILFLCSLIVKVIRYEQFFFIIAVTQVKTMDQWTEKDILNVPPTLVFLLLFIKQVFNAFLYIGPKNILNHNIQKVCLCVCQLHVFAQRVKPQVLINSLFTSYLLNLFKLKVTKSPKMKMMKPSTLTPGKLR